MNGRVFPGHRVTLTRAGFDLDRVEVKVGAEVTFTNSDSTARELSVADALNVLAPGATYQHTAVAPGEYVYRSGDHSGVLYVT